MKCLCRVHMSNSGKNKKHKVEINEGNITRKIRSGLSLHHFKIFLQLKEVGESTEHETKKNRKTICTNTDKIYLESVDRIKTEYKKIHTNYTEKMRFYYHIVQQLDVYINDTRVFDKRVATATSGFHIEASHCDVDTLEGEMYDIESVLCISTDYMVPRNYFKVSTDVKKSKIYKRVLSMLKLGCLVVMTRRKTDEFQKILDASIPDSVLDIIRHHNVINKVKTRQEYLDLLADNFSMYLESRTNQIQFNIEIEETLDFVTDKLEIIKNKNEAIEKLLAQFS